MNQGGFTVAPGKAQSFQFSAPPAGGRAFARVASSVPVDVYIFDADNMQLYADGRPAHAIAASTGNVEHTINLAQTPLVWFVAVQNRSQAVAFGSVLVQYASPGPSGAFGASGATGATGFGGGNFGGRFG